MNGRFPGSLCGDVVVTRHRASSGVAASRIIALLSGLAALAIAPVQVAADAGHKAFFAEPASGRKVTHYTVDLAVGRETRQSFVIPDDCDSVMRALEERKAYRGRIVDRRLWHKVEGDCHYDGFLHRHPRQALQDYVSDYDFMNARLSDLPIDRRCAGASSNSGETACDPMATDASGLLRHFPLAQPLQDGAGGDECECELTNGVFRGHLFVDEQGVRCTTDPDAPSLRLIAVDFADINGDRVLDAVLRFVPLRAGPARMPLILPLTRFEPDAPFSVPELQRPTSPIPPTPPARDW
ncbi:MAG: ferric uptake regulator family protein [Sedimenticolaceae bacterium]